MIQDELSQSLYTATQVRDMDRLAIDRYGFDELALMERAGRSVFEQMMSRYLEVRTMVVVCGSGNNGGDGYVVAQCALIAGIDVQAIVLGEPRSEQSKACQQAYLMAGGRIADEWYKGLREADIVVDGLFGTGLNRSPSGRYAEIIGLINRLSCPVVAIDIPSGLNGDTGNLFSPCVLASLTVSFIGLKIGLFTGPGRAVSGEIRFDTLGLSDQIHAHFEPVGMIMSPPVLDERPHHVHKGECGRVVVAGGEAGLLGAVLLAGKAALRCGSGLVTVMSIPDHVDMPALYCSELMSISLENGQGGRDTIERCDVIVLGPGMGRGCWGEVLFDTLIESNKPMVLDADGLYWLAEKPHRSNSWILTPHPGEAGKLLACSSADIQADRRKAALAIARRYGGICVLKGPGTMVVDEQGHAQICHEGNAGMASAGMGDVLSGIIGSLLGQRLTLFDAAAYGVWLHSGSADRKVKQVGTRGLLASDVIEELPFVIEQRTGRTIVAEN